ncbi:MAG: hypothetical protein ABSD74_09165 [Rhizomicrobium sp.]
MTVRFVCILAVPRTGSSHASSLLRRCPELNVKGEIFNRSTQMPARDLGALASASGKSGEDSAAIIEWCRSNPASTLETLYQAGGYQILVFKLFAGHVAKELIRDQLFSRDDVRYILLGRRPIESFISVQKAKIVSSFKRVDTTPLKPELDADEFIIWAKRVRGWYKWLGKQMDTQKHPSATLSYERDLDGKADDEALAHILGLLDTLGISDIRPPKFVAGTVRQDREQDFRKRVSNWTEFEAWLSSVPSRAELLQWAEEDR